MKIPDIITDQDNFWEYNPQYKYILSDFYNADKSKNKNKSSKLIWAIYFRTHPKSDFYRLPDKDDIIKTKWLKQPKFEWDSIQETADLFTSSTLSQAEKSLIAWDTTMKKRDIFIHGQAFTLDTYDEKGKIVKGTADQLDKMLGTTGKLYLEYFKIAKELSNDDIKRGKGNRPQSLSDANEI
jgi:hypothetical protein